MQKGLYSDLITYSFEQGEHILGQRSEVHRKQLGQFFTPPEAARFMAHQLGPIKSGDRILEPAIGSGVLACAVIDYAIAQGQPLEFWLDGYEIDPELCRVVREVLKQATEYAASRGIIVHAQVHEEDFVLTGVTPSQPYLFLADSSNHPGKYAMYSHVIANPPYFKLNSNDPRVAAVTGQIQGHTNIYTLFIGLAIKKLLPGGRACFIVPRSFCSGRYFSSFRKDFIQEALPLAAHLFDSRQDTFKDDSVLQENIIFAFCRRPVRSSQLPAAAHVNISASKDASELNSRLISRQISIKQFVGQRYGTLFFRLPTGELDEQIVETVDRWTGSLSRYGLDASTGPVVAFRARSWLMKAEAVSQEQAVPLLWMHNVRPQQVEWPAARGDKPQAISTAREAQSLLLPVKNYVLLRRFSAKEDVRRLIAAPFLADRCHYPWIGLENHLNYLYRKAGDLQVEEAVGLAALLNSALLDRYFRIVNGNTQVNAAELRALPLPPLELIKQLGRDIEAINGTGDAVDIEAIIFTILQDSGYLSPDFPLIRETRFTMGKIQEAQDILKTLGLPLAQQNEISALTLLVLAQLSEETSWNDAKRQSLRIHDVLLEIKQRYNREYAENTRETIRRQVIHQFEQAGIVVRNPDDPTLSTNSPLTHYALSDAAIRTIRTYRSSNWGQAVRSFIESQGALLEVYQKKREQHKIPLRLASGEEYHLSPGPHNQLQVAIVEEFGPRFAPGAKLLYLGDAENKTLILDKEGFQELGIPVPHHDKLPDVVFYDETRNWIFLVEAVTSHGPVSPKRYVELEAVWKDCLAGRVYVSAFPDFVTFKSFLSEIAWETEVWLAEIPDHLIHSNGDRFLGPRN